jgi:hypothetical protein
MSKARREISELQSQENSSRRELGNALATARLNEKEAIAARQEASEARGTVEDVHLDLKDRFDEITTLTSALLDEERRADMNRRQLDWLRNVNQLMFQADPWWWGIMPAVWRQKKTLDRIRAEGLFDAESYLRHYPDVTVSGQNPLRHYIVHGIDENRTF